MSLPLEALSFLQEDNICSVTRDFSLQMLQHRVAKKSPDGTGKKGGEKEKKIGLVRESNPGPLAPEARIIPLDQQAS